MVEDAPPARRSGPVSALEIALEDGNHALTLLLLCNGYDPNLEYHCPLDRALSSRRWDLLDMLLDWGTDPLKVDPYAVMDTYQSGLFERFWTLGVDLTDGNAMADTLAHHTRNKPLYGWAKRHRDNPAIQRELNMALGYHAEEGNERGVALCLWAGADPHAPAPNLRWGGPSVDDDEEEEDRFLGWTAIYEACSHGHVEILKKLGPDPALDDFEELYREAYSGSVVQVLAAMSPPNGITAVIRHQLWRLCSPFRDDRWQVMSAIRSIFEIPVRWESASSQEIASIRRELLRCPWNSFVDVLKLFATGDHVAPEILIELGRTPAFRKRMKDVCFIPPGPKDPARLHRRYERDRPTRSHEVLAKFGIRLPKPKAPPSPPGPPPPPRIEQIGRRRPGSREIRLTREELYQRVWSTPIIRLARAWGMSDRGLGKACRRLLVPVPPRGYWARLEAGQRPGRPRLPKLKSGEVEAIVVWEGE